jgi:hypothetical protein
MYPLEAKPSSCADLNGKVPAAHGLLRCIGLQSARQVLHALSAEAAPVSIYRAAAPCLYPDFRTFILACGNLAN